MTLDTRRARLVQIRGLHALLRVLGAASPGATSYTAPGVVASVVPSAPSDYDVNAVAFCDQEDLASSLSTIQRRYDGHGIVHWSVWVPDSDDGVRHALTALGYTCEAWLPAIALDLTEFNPRRIGDLDYDSDGDISTLGRINALAYGRPSVARSFAITPNLPEMRVYQARLGGEPVATLLTNDVLGDSRQDCAASFLAVRPDLQGAGIGPRLFTAALLEARARGCVTCTGQASPMGAPVYARMGFATVFQFARYVSPPA